MPSTEDTVHAAAPPVGLVEVTTLPVPSTATHNVVLGQEIPLTGLLPSTFDTDHAVAPPVGLTEVTTSPDPSAATHNVLLGHERARG